MLNKQLRAMMLIAAVCGGVSITTKATAQYTNPYTGTTWNNPVSSYLDTVIQGNMQMQNLMINQSIQRNALESSIESQQEEGEETQTSDRNQEQTEENGNSSERNLEESEIAATSFHPVARAILPQKIAAEMGKTPNEQREYEQNFSKLLEYYESYVQERQWQLHDVAHAISYYIGASYYVYSGKDLDAQQAWGVYNNVSQVLTQNKVLQNLNDAQKQEMYEAMAIQGALPLLGYNISVEQGDKSGIAKFREDAKQNLEKLFGVSAAKLQLTAQGITINN